MNPYQRFDFFSANEMHDFARNESGVPEEVMELTSYDDRESKRTSMLYHVLPALVQSRIPSFRRSLSTYRRRGLHSKSNSVAEMSRPCTPPPDYTSRPGSGSSTPSRQASDASDSVFDYEDDRSDAPSSAASDPPPAEFPMATTHEPWTGINWQRATQAWLLLRSAHEQSSPRPPMNDAALTTIIRAQFVHGIRMLLESLPHDLTDAEIRNLHAAVPQTILNAQKPQGNSLVVRDAARAPSSSSGSLLWRASAWTILKLLFVVQFLLPYIAYFFRRAVAIDNEYQISTRVFNTSVNTASYISREGLRVSQAVFAMNDGAVRDAIYNGALYVAGEVAGGMQEGVRQAMNQS
ncbi:hypothetical protein BKA63DRAFT_502588 [Paraphoma chrysanthemicola]|nr:hypothetical protein BKA63DRAFT_502588 [Paraphoma chrysanthemicola]